MELSGEEGVCARVPVWPYEYLNMYHYILYLRVELQKYAILYILVHVYDAVIAYVETRLRVCLLWGVYQVSGDPRRKQ